MMPSLEHTLLHSLNASGWKKVGVHPHHGIALPLFSLHSQKSCGIGEFYDLLPLITWCQTLKLDILQLLPLNALGPDFSPYNAVSSCALSELYLSCHALPFLEESKDLKNQVKELQSLSKTSRISYQEVYTHKFQFFHAYLALFGERLFKQEETQAFLAKNPWVKPYALFKTLKTHSQEAPMHTWAPHLQIFNQKEAEKLYITYEREIRFYSLLQFLCFSQVSHVKQKAEEANVHLMGDIPILINRESVDLWCYPECFDTNLAAGSPPDAYNQDGQYWGFPIPRLEIFRKTHFRFWKERLHVASLFYDLFRIDHVIGFFHLWCIPLDRPSQEGFYLPKESQEWDASGKEWLNTLCHAARGMLPIAEDLGTVPPTLRPTLLEMGICGTKVLRWERDWDKTKAFTPIDTYPPMSLTTVGTHDTSPLALWWQEEKEAAQIYAQEKGWPYSEKLLKEHHEQILKESHKTSSLFHVNPLQEYLALFPELTSESLEEERINIPGTFSPKNWTYRFRQSIEEIISHEGLLETMRRILS